MLSALFRRKFANQPLPPHWQQILTDHVPPSLRLPARERLAFEKHLQILLNEKKFEGCRQLTITDEMRVTVAGYAALLLLHHPDGYYPRLGTIVIYPESFATPVRAVDQSGIVTEGVEERLGESWQEGTVVLAWESIRQLVQGRSGDCNVIIHEFAHQFDAQRGLTSACRLVAQSDQCRDWEDLRQAELLRQRAASRRGKPTALDPYAFTSPEELFAVASEIFFMRPVRFKTHHPELYRELQAAYGVDPAGWMDAPFAESLRQA